MIEIANKTHTTEEVMGVMEPLISTWFNERFAGLTEPQAKAIPEIHKRKNVLVSSPTGSGKTLTAFTSIINELTRYASEGRLEERIYCVYISPLKALANDVNRNLTTPLEEMKAVAEEHGMNIPNIKVAVRSGDTSQNDRQKMVRHPPHILITTPESLALIMAAPKFKENLRKVEWVILDEIHDICDSKRGAFLSLTLERMRQFCENDFSRIGLSATLAPIDAIAGYLVGCNGDGSVRDVTLIESDSKKRLDLKVICPTEDMTALSSDIVNSMMYDTLKELVDAHETTLVFTNTRSGAESVVYKLKERGLENVEVHHSSLGKEMRLNVEERLKRGEIKCVVSSTSLELGIDIGSVDLVCQIGSPKSVAKGLQRIGRSGHSFGKVAKGRLIVFDLDDLAECAVMCRAAHRGDIDRVGIPENCLDVLSQTVVGMSLDSKWMADDAYEIVKGSYCYRNLRRESFIGVLRYLGSKDEHEGVYSKIWYDEEEGQFGRKKGSRMIYLMNLGTIPEEANYRVVTGHGSTVGELSEKFVERLSPRDVFVLGGRSMEFVRSKGMIAHVKEAGGRKPTVPSWAGEMLPRSFDLSMDVAVFRKEMAGLIDGEDGELIPKISSEFDIDEGSARSLISYFREQKAVTGIIPDNERLAIEEYIDPSGNQRIIFHFPFGRRVNDALSRGYAYRISNALGANVSVTITDDNFMIGTSRKTDVADIPGLLGAADIEPILRKAVKDSEIFKLRFRHTAARSFMILRNYMGRPISVNRQQMRSSYLLDALGGMDNEPVIEETYREVLEDDMDIKNAQVVLEMIDDGRMSVSVFPFNGMPSPFAHSVILSGFSDIVLMEDRSALLKELHRKVLHRALGDSIKDFEFEEDQIIPYFRQKIGRITCKEDIPALLSRTGPLQAIKERGRNIYAYADEDKKIVDGWVRELIKEKKIGTVFLDEPYIMNADDIPTYASATAKERELSDTDRKVLECVGERTALSDVTAELKISEDVTFRSMRKLESMYLVTRTDIDGNNRWYFTKAEHSRVDKLEALDLIVERYLNCFAPATVPEVAFALSITDGEARSALESCVAREIAAKGSFLVSESPQYMKSIDRMRLRAGKENVYSHSTLEAFRQSKGASFGSIREYMEFFMAPGSEIDVFNRVESFDLQEWYGMRESGEIILGRFVRGRVKYMLRHNAAKMAALRPEAQLSALDEDILSRIEGSGKATMRQLTADTGRSKEEVKESLLRLDHALKIVRSFEDREDWGTENTYAAYHPEAPGGDPLREMMENYVRAYGPTVPSVLSYVFETPPERVAEILAEIGAVQIFEANNPNCLYIMPDEAPLLSETGDSGAEVVVRSLYDVSLSGMWMLLSSRFGDRWVYPVTRGPALIGGLEIWEMSGCVEIRGVDLDAPELLPDVLKAVDRLMRFFNMKGVDVVRVREVMGVDASQLDGDAADAMASAGYVRVNGFYAKGRFIPRTMPEQEYMDYVFYRQRVGKDRKYETVDQAVKARGYIRNDQEIITRVSQKTTVRKELDRRNLVKMSLLPSFVGYTSLNFAPLYLASKHRDEDPDSKTLLALIKARQPAPRKEIVAASMFSSERTTEILSELSGSSQIYLDADSCYNVVPRKNIGRREALKKVAMRHFEDIGIFSAEELAQFLGTRMSETRRVLADLESEGSLVKGFLLKDDPILRWMPASDRDFTPPPFREMFLLNTQDNLHLYLRSYIKAETGTTDCVVFDGTRIVGHFKGKVDSTGAKVENFEGSDKANLFVKKTARSCGVRIEDRKKVDDNDDWSISEFYLKTNPGA
ncbi:MAG: ATP-dependent helicase [Candidatus Methanoplasma sp.]|jgi:ATP-dependent Lhr-like helicase|nr:ATP-dependent helicase [Candidatus Methanoplasma sp.]